VLAETLSETKLQGLKPILPDAVEHSTGAIIQNPTEWKGLVPLAKRHRAAGVSLSRVRARRSKATSKLVESRWGHVAFGALRALLESATERSKITRVLESVVRAEVEYELSKGALDRAVKAEIKKRREHNDRLTQTKRQALLALKSEEQDQIARLYLNGLGGAGVEFIHSLPTPESILGRCADLGLKLPASRFTEAASQRLLEA